MESSIAQPGEKDKPGQETAFVEKAEMSQLCRYVLKYSLQNQAGSPILYKECYAV